MIIKKLNWFFWFFDYFDQGGILAGNLGARLPRNLQTHMKFLQQFTLFWRKFDLKVRISCQMKEFFLSHTTCRKYFLVTGRNFLALQVTNFHRKKFIVTERNLSSRAEISWQKLKFHAAGNFLSQEAISCLRKKFLVSGRNFLALEEISCHRKKLFVKGRNFMPQL